MYLPYNVGINKIHTKSVPRKCQLITWKHLSCLSLYFFQPSVTVDITSSIFPAVNYLVQGLTNCPTKAVTVGIVSDNTLLLWNSKLLKKSSLPRGTQYPVKYFSRFSLSCNLYRTLSTRDVKQKWPNRWYSADMYKLSGLVKMGFFSGNYWMNVYLGKNVLLKCSKCGNIIVCFCFNEYVSDAISGSSPHLSGMDLHACACACACVLFM